MTTKTPVRVRDLVATLLLAAVIYSIVSCVAYAYRNPEMTQTQLIQHFWDAVRWR